MPLVECLKCGKQEVVPLAISESIQGDLPAPRFDTSNTPIYPVYCPACQPLKIEVVEGDLLDQDVDVIVNAWNRNIIPWWLLLPQGVSGAIKRRAGTAPFKEVAKHGAIPLGGAVLTSAGKLPFRGIIHVAGINMLWRASERSIRDSVKNSVTLAHEEGFSSMALPLIGAGSGGFNQEQTKALVLDELQRMDVPMRVKVVVFPAKKKTQGYSTQGNPNGLQMLEKHSALPLNRIRYLPNADAKVIESIDRGVLFLMAFWSFSSLKSFARMTETLSRLDESARLEFVVVDIDGSPSLYEVSEIGEYNIQGNGEAAWIRQGNIVSSTRQNAFGDLPETNTVALMKMP